VPEKLLFQEFVYREKEFQKTHEFASEYPGEVLNFKEIHFSRFRFGNRLPVAFQADTSGRNDAMDMGMKGKVLSPGMQDGDHSSISIHPDKKKLRQRTPDSFEEQVIHQSSILKKKPVQLIGNSKYHMEIGNR
jgi:hypothetical protein